jgi:Zn-dependent peptidase ImmA (M78 family)
MILIFKAIVIAVYFLYAIIFWPYKLYRIPKSKEKRKLLLNEALEWCILNVKIDYEIKSKPKIVIHNHSKGATLGTYNYYSKTITIYVNRHSTLKSLIDTLIHEFTHFIQFKTEIENKLYDEQSKEVSYWENRFEKEARCFAEIYRSACLKHLKKGNFIN